jgi:hypothetical protein
MPRWVFSVSLSVIVAALVAGAFVWYTDRPSSYDECVVHEMRGQSSLMMSAVSKMCAIRFEKEDEVPLSFLTGGKLEFMRLPDFDKDPGVVMAGGKLEKAPWVVTVLKNETDYEITRVRMKHSFNFEVDCSRVADEDWGDGPEFAFSKGVANVIMPTRLVEETKLYRVPFCYQYVKIWGRLRKQ